MVLMKSDNILNEIQYVYEDFRILICSEDNVVLGMLYCKVAGCGRLKHFKLLGSMPEHDLIYEVLHIIL